MIVVGERHTGSVEVSGSIPLCSTKNRKPQGQDLVVSLYIGKRPDT